MYGPSLPNKFANLYNLKNLHLHMHLRSDRQEQVKNQSINQSIKNKIELFILRAIM